MRTYSTRDEAVQAEIIGPIEATGEVTNARAEFDIDAIADAVLWVVDQPYGYGSKVEPEEFWSVAAEHAR